jgi:non-heme chloroperoxidase
MTTIRTRDGTEIFYKDWGSGQPIMFCHGWPLNADSWEDQMLFLAARGYRCIAPDRRGFGRSGQPWSGYDFDTLADDLATLIDALDLKEVCLVGFSMGGGDVARYIGRHGTARVAKAALIAAIPPQMLKTAANPGGIDRAALDGIRDSVRADRSQHMKDVARACYGAGVSQGVLDWFWLMAMQASLKATFDSIAAFSETDFTEDLKRFDVPTLILHGDEDALVPIGATSLRAAELIATARLKVYEGAPHGICTTHKDRVNADLLAHLKS